MNLFSFYFPFFHILSMPLSPSHVLSFKNVPRNPHQACFILWHIHTLLWISFLSTGLSKASISYPSSQKTKSFPCPFNYQEGHKMGRISHVPLTFPFHPLLIHPHIPPNPPVALYYPHFHKFLTFPINLPHIAFYSNLPLWIAFEAISIIRHIIYPQSGKTIP